MNINKININVDSKSITLVHTTKDGQRRVTVISGQRFGLLRNKTIPGTGKNTYDVVKQMLQRFLRQQHVI